MTIETGDDGGLIPRVKAWAEKTGLPLELETRLVLEASCLPETEFPAFDVQSSVSFVDPETGKGREIDVVASYKSRYFIQFDIAIECKASDKPWLVVVDELTPRRAARGERFGIASSRTLERWKQRGDTIDSLCHEPQGVFLASHMSDGFIFKQAFSQKESDDAYAASMSALKAAVALVQASQHPLVHFVWPVIVVDSPIIECAVNAAGVPGEIAFNEVETSDFLFTTYLGTERTRSLIRVVHKRSLVKFVEMVRDYGTLMNDQFVPRIPVWLHHDEREAEFLASDESRESK